MSAEDRTDETGVDARAEMVRGLREMADFLEANPAVPAPSWALAQNYLSRYGGMEPPTKEQLLAVGGEVTVAGDRVAARREFSGGVTLKIEAFASDICVEREVVTSEFVLPEELAPPEPESEMAPADTTAVTW